MCLCPCSSANNFYGTGSYYLGRVHPGRVEKDICTYCGQRPGFDYEVIKENRRRKMTIDSAYQLMFSEYPDIVTVPKCKMLEESV